MITPKLKQYAAAFQSGAAALCLRQAEYKVGIFAYETSELVKQYYEQKLPEKIAAKADEDMKSLDEVGVIDEIRTNVLALKQQDREAYIKDTVLTKFKDWSDSLLSNEVRQIMMRDSLSRFWYNSLRSFAVKLDAMLLHYGIDLMRLQEECGVYLQKERNMSMLGYYMGSKEYAQKCVDAVTKKREPQQEEKPVLIDDTVILMKVYNEFNGEIWANVRAVDFVAMMQTGDLTKLKILSGQKSKMMKILNCTRHYQHDKTKAKQWRINVKNSAGIDIAKATLEVKQREIDNSKGMTDFGKRLSRVFTILFKRGKTP